MGFRTASRAGRYNGSRGRTPKNPSKIHLIAEQKRKI
jgi:hypothetical protein